MQSTISALIAAAVLFLALAACGGAPIGKELAQVNHQGEAYLLVEYGGDLAIFSKDGAPVSNQNTAQGVMSSYAWQQELDAFDSDMLADISGRVEEVNYSLSVTRSLSNDVVDIFDELDAMDANIPFIGRISALDVVRDSYPGLSDGEYAIRALASELNDLSYNADTLTDSVERVVGIDPSSVSADEMDSLFSSALSATYSLESSIRFVQEGVSDVREIAEHLERALRESSDTPIIGNALGNFAESVGRFESRLSAFSSLLGDLEDDLPKVSKQLQDTIDSVNEASQEYMDSWLQEPHDTEWPPTDPERRSG